MAQVMALARFRSSARIRPRRTYGSDLYNPTTGTWLQGPLPKRMRAPLPQTARVLLPDGCVIVTGSNPVRGNLRAAYRNLHAPLGCSIRTATGSPWANRPQINSAPAKIGYSGTFPNTNSKRQAGANLPDVASRGFWSRPRPRILTLLILSSE